MRILLVIVAAAFLLAQGALGSIITYEANLTGAESGTTGLGFATVTVDTMANSMTVDVSFSGLTSGTTASHIHCCTASAGTGTAGVATQVPTFLGFPLGVTSGTYGSEPPFDLTQAASYNPAFITANGGTSANAEAALLAGLAADKAYLNIHTTLNPGGEISGFLVAVPEPGTLLLTVSALVGLGFWRKRGAKP
jgi:CHRD domain-containing protein/PEP-CTERM motif-containing protein